jgi:nicotinamidase-related amidase
LEALLILEMQNDLIYADLAVTIKRGQLIIPNIRKILLAAREGRRPIVYVNLLMYPQDPIIIKNKLPQHCLIHSPGANVIEELRPQEEDYVVNIHRMDGFLGSNLDFLLRDVLDVEGIIVTGVSTGVGCLLTALGAIQRGMKAILVSDACATYTEDRHETALEFFRKNLGFIDLRTTEEVVAVLRPDGP